MSITDAVQSVTRTFGLMKLSTIKNSPTIMVGVAVVGVVATAVLASHAGSKMDDVISDDLADIGQLKDMKDDAPESPFESHQELESFQRDISRDIVARYARMSLKVAKLYAPTVITGAVTVGLLVQSHRIMLDRNATLLGAYAVLDRTFAKYRDQVRERFGDEEEHRVMYETTHDKQDVVDENGEVVATLRIPERNTTSRLFDETNPNWRRCGSKLDNEFFLRRAQNDLTQMLRSRGYLFLNEVYDALSLEMTPEGQILGWYYNPNNPDLSGDGIVDFGIYDDTDERKVLWRVYPDGRTGVWLDFNYEGPVHTLI